MKVSQTTHEESDAYDLKVLRESFNNLSGIIELKLPPGRRRSLALTHLEIASMFAIKAATVGGD